MALQNVKYNIYFYVTSNRRYYRSSAIYLYYANEVSPLKIWHVLGHQLTEMTTHAAISTEGVNTFVCQFQAVVAVHAGMDSMFSTKQNVSLRRVSWICKYVS